MKNRHKNEVGKSKLFQSVANPFVVERVMDTNDDWQRIVVGNTFGDSPRGYPKDTIPGVANAHTDRRYRNGK